MNEKFKAIVEKGIDALIRYNPEVPNGGFKITLRYIDCFNDILSKGMTHRDFLGKILGIKVDIPDVLKSLSATKDNEVPLMQIVTPLNFGVYQIQFAEGTAGEEKGFIMESAVSVIDEFLPDSSNIMNGFSKARNVIHEGFIKMTEPLHKDMGIYTEADNV